MLASAPARLEQEPSFSQGMLARLRRAMDQLSDADREIVELRHHGGMSFKQMADMLGEPVGTLLARHHRALRKLRDVMEPDRNKETGDSHEDAADDEVRR
jgi:RNA polymerase sigma-70 factor (ECF subfamily)